MNPSELLKVHYFLKQETFFVNAVLWSSTWKQLTNNKMPLETIKLEVRYLSEYVLSTRGLSQLECCLHNLWSFWLDLNIEGG